MKIPQSVRELLPKAPLAHLTTINSDGGPQVTVMWVGIENQEFVIGHMFVHKKVRNVRHDGRVALSLLGDKTNAEGLREYVVIYGNARVTDGAAIAVSLGKCSRQGDRCAADLLLRRRGRSREISCSSTYVRPSAR